MQLYAVRIKELFEAVGVFYCDLADLYDMVDEATDPNECEYTIITNIASVIWPLPFSPTWHHDEEDYEESKEAMPQLGSSLWVSIFNKEAEWRDVQPN